MTLDEIMDMVKGDMEIDNTELEKESLKIPQLHNKYLTLFHKERITLKAKLQQKKILQKDLWEYYTGKMSQEDLERFGRDPFPHKVMKHDIDRYIESDSEVIKLDARICLLTEKVEYLEGVLKSLTRRQWDIKNAIDWRKFINGL